jgi:hypothetical protein
MVLAFLGLLAVQTSVKAGSITNNFNNSLDYLANGVPGSMWDGVYLGFGDVPGGNDAGDVGYSLQANETANPNFLTVQSSQTDWAGSGDDGFFLWKTVAGDFDVSVQNVEPFANPNYHMGGLLARAFTTNGPAWGAPYGGSENSVYLPRFQEFGVDEDIRYTTNGIDMDAYISVPGTDSDTNTSRYFRITRVGNVFSFYTKTNQSDAWALHGSLTRSDLAGAPMQVGIADSTFGSSTPTTFYTDFELTGTNVTATVTRPTDPSGLVATILNPTQVKFSWTPGAGSAGSILVIRKNNALVKSDKPIDGYNYNANTNFSSGDNLGGGIYVVYAGTGGSVTNTGLGNVVDTDYAAVYSYSGSGASIVYGANPAKTSTAGPAPVVSVSASLTPTNIPVNGAAVIQTIVNYGDGSTATNPAAGVTFASGNTSVAVTGNGTVGTATGIAVGTAEIIATYGGLSGSNAVTVNLPAYTNNFSVSHDYITNGLAASTNGSPGSTWDGLYLRPGDVPHASYTGAPVNTTVFDANVTSNNVLSIRAAHSGWQGTSDNGPFIFKVVPGDFQASVHITGYSILNYEFIGLLARAFSAVDNASPNGPGYAENFIDWMRFDEFGVTTATFDTRNGGNTETDNNDGESTDYWLLMSRVSGTNFYFFKKANLTDPWILAQTITRPDFTNGVPLQVGLEQSMFTGNNGLVQFDSFSLDAANISGGTPPSATAGFTMAYNANNNTMNLTWTPGTNSNGSVQTSFVVMRQGAPISAQPYFGDLTSANSIFGQGTDLGGGNYVVYRGTGGSVIVSGLTAGAVYYAAVYGYSGSGATKSFNLAGSASSGSVQAGVFTNITASLSSQIPVGGVGLPVVLGILNNGAKVDVSSSSVIYSGNTNVVVATNGVVTGLAIGSETNAVTFISGTTVFTNYFVAVVRAPTFTDNFSATHDYIANGATNTTWDGVYAYPTFKIPDSTHVSDPAADVFSADAGITSNNVLTVTSENVGFENGQNDGFYLFKYTSGDFQMAVHITTALLDTNGAVIAAYNYPGLLARPYSVDTNGNAGAPLTTNGDNWVSWARFDEFGIGTRAELIRNNGTTAQPSADVGDGQLWLLMVRQNSTNFLFYQRANATDPWRPGPAGQKFAVNAFAGLPMQVGIEEGAFNSGNVATAQFDSFMLDVQSVGPILVASGSSGHINVSWPQTWPGGPFNLQSAISLSPPINWQPMAGTVVITNGFDVMSIPETNAVRFFRLVH